MGLAPKYRVPIKITHNYLKISRIIEKYRVNTVCSHSLCPNITECWGSGTATFMILGDTCTRACRFCYVKKGTPSPPDPDEPLRVALAAKEMELDYVVITSVSRDDLEDFGASHYVETIREVKKHLPGALIEVLIPDFQGRLDLVETIIDAGIDVLGHNIETVKRLTPKIRDPRASYERSLMVLRYSKKYRPTLITKSSIILGFGESWSEVLDAMRDLRSADVDILVISQYLRPSSLQVPVTRNYSMREFKELEKIGYKMGFKYILSHPFARTSYKAKDAYYRARRSV